LPADYNTDLNKIEPPTHLKKPRIEEDEDIDEDRRYSILNINLATKTVNRMREASGLVRTGRLFGGLFNDIKRKTPWYLKDFLHVIIVNCKKNFS